MNPAFFQEQVVVVENVPLARDTFRVRLHCPEIARAFLPGSFLCCAGPEPLIRSLAALRSARQCSMQPDSRKRSTWVTSSSANSRGYWLRCNRATAGGVGTIGNGFPAARGFDHVASSPDGWPNALSGLTRQLLGTRGYGGLPACKGSRRVSLYYGVRTATLAACVDDFPRGWGRSPSCQRRRHRRLSGFVTQLLEQHSRHNICSVVDRADVEGSGRFGAAMEHSLPSRWSRRWPAGVGVC